MLVHKAQLKVAPLTKMLVLLLLLRIPKATPLGVATYTTRAADKYSMGVALIISRSTIIIRVSFKNLIEIHLL
jgi:hypothetical protein